MKYYIHHFKELKFYYASFVAIIVISTFFSIVVSNYISTITTSITNQQYNSILSLLLPLILFYFLTFLFNKFLFNYLSSKLEAFIYSKLYTSIIKKINSLPYDHPFLQKQKESYTLLQSDCSTVVTNLSETVVSVLCETIRLLLILLYILFLSPFSFIVYFISVIISLLLQWLSSKSIENVSKIAKESEIQMNSAISDVLSHRFLIKTYQAYSYSKDMYSSIQQKNLEDSISLSKTMMPVKMIGIFCGMLPLLSLCLATIIAYPYGIITLSNFMSVYYLCSDILPTQLHYADLISSFRSEFVSLDRVANFLKEEIKEPEISYSDSISMSHVYYQYPNTDTYALENISFSITPHSKVAFIGESGSGKTTALKLLANLYFPTSGKVLTNKALLTQQFPFLFQDTIKENVTLNSEDSSFNQSIKDAQIDTYIETLPDKENTLLQNNGNTLSGGQRQRISLARAFYHSFPIKLFDESISALDATTANTIMHTLLNSSSTCIFSLHQLEYLPYMDQIILFKNGKILFNGNYEQYKKEYLS